MIGEKEAARMDYLTYKRTFWRRMLDWWLAYKAEHPERAEFNAERIAIAEAQIRRWAA